MVSKKEAIILGIALLGGLGLASMMGQDGGGAGTEARYRTLPGGILGSTPDAAPAVAPSIINIPAESFAGFPQQTEPQWIQQFLQPAPVVTAAPVPTVSTSKKQVRRSIGTSRAFKSFVKTTQTKTPIAASKSFKTFVKTTQTQSPLALSREFKSFVKESKKESNSGGS